MDEEVDEVVGPKGRHDPDRFAARQPAPQHAAGGGPPKTERPESLPRG
jgi:hypothetical protein